jgi:taurine dioxygenase
MKLELASPALGVIASDVDVRTMSSLEFEQLYQAFLDHGVLCVRGQELTIEQYVAYSKRFGRLKPHRVRKTRHPDFPEITLMGYGTKTATGQVNKSVYGRGAGWHTDSSWDQEVCKATQLYGIAIPSYGGDTLFANTYMAYDALPQALKDRIEDLEGIAVYGGRDRDFVDLLEPQDRDLPPSKHRIVREHAETGRRSLYLSPGHIVAIDGLPKDESDALIEELTGYLIQPGAEYRHKWQKGDIVIWDNRCTLHAATGGYPIEEPRIHWRTTIMQ